MNNTAPFARNTFALFAILLPLSMSGCSGRAARIATFAVSPTSITAGEKAQLCYELTNAASARVEPTVGALADSNKSCLSVEPRQTTTYTLSAMGKDGKTVSEQATLAVQEPPPVANIALFEAKRAETAVPAPGSPADLCYEVRGASSLRIEPAVGEVEPVDKGCRTVKPDQTTTYKLTATGSDSRPVSKETTVNVVHDPPRITRFELTTPAAIKAGEKVTLCYNVEDATRANIDNLTYAVKLGQNECVTFQPRRTSTYTLEARNQDGQLAAKQVRVTVEQPPAEITAFRPQSPEIEKGSKAVIHYAVKAAGARISFAGGTEKLTTAEGDFEHRPVATTTYTLTAVNLDGAPVSSAVDVKVVPPAQARIFGFVPNPPTITRGQDVKLTYGVTWGSRAKLSSETQRASRDLESSEKTSITIRPTATDIYTLTAIGPNGQPVTAQAKVTVNEPTYPPPSAALIVKIGNQSGGRISIRRGDLAQVCYNVANVATARISPSFDQGVDIVNGWRCLNLPTLPTTTTYTLNVKGLNGTTLVRQAIVDVYPPPEILFFGPRPNDRNSICYRFRFASSAQITPQIGVLQINPQSGATRSGEACIPANPASAYTLTVRGFGSVPPAVATSSPR